MAEDWFENPRWLQAPKHILSAAAVVVRDSTELLMVRSPRRGWEVPGGQVEQGEQPTVAAVREVEEESGIHIEIDGFCGVFYNSGKGICNLLFAGHPVGGVLRTSDESPEVGWFELPGALDKITYPTFRQRAELCLDRTRWPFLVEF